MKSHCTLSSVFGGGVWLLSLTIITLRFIHVGAYMNSLSILSSISLYEYATFCLSIGHLGCFQFLVIMNNIAVNFHGQVFV